MSEALINGLAGAGGGIVSQLITYPLQTVTTWKQTERDPEKRKAQPGTIEQICQVVKEEGWGRLYGGLTPSLVGIAASQGVYYYFYQIFRTKAEASALDRRKKGTGNGSVGMPSSLMVAALSGCVNVLLTNPIWVVVTRMQTYGKYLRRSHRTITSHAENEAFLTTIEPLAYGTGNAIEEVYAEAGVFGFWKGVIPALIMVINPSIQFMLYETMLNKLKKGQTQHKTENNVRVTAVQTFLLGALAKLGAISVTYPLVVIKSRLQTKQASNGDEQHHYKGTVDAFMKIIRFEGLSGLYTGMRTKIVQSVLAAAVLFTVKEEIVKCVGALLADKPISRSKSKPS